MKQKNIEKYKDIKRGSAFQKINLKESKKTIKDEETIKIKNSIEQVMKWTDCIFDFRFNENGLITEGNEQYNPLDEIMLSGNIKKAKKFINIYSEMYPGKSIKNEMECYDLLHKSIVLADMSFAKMLIEDYKLDVNSESNEERTPLTCAIEYVLEYEGYKSNMKGIKLLIKNGAEFCFDKEYPKIDDGSPESKTFLSKIEELYNERGF